MSRISPVGLLVFLFAVAISCDDGPGTPEVTTLEPTDITSGSAEAGGNIRDEGDSPVTERGIVWDITPGPTIENSGVIKDGSGGGGSFKVLLAPLLWVTTYYVRAYAINGVGTSYGNEVSFTTLPTGPILETSPVGEITSTSALVTGEVVADGGAPVTTRGILWNTKSEFNLGLPTKTTVAGSGLGIFTATITGLQPGTKYYVFAYATNSVGTGLSNPVTFTTRAAEPTKVFFFDVVATPTDFESVTIKNNSGADKDISGWTIGDLNNPTAYRIPNGTILAQGQSKFYPRTTLGFAINDNGETLYLKDAAGATVDMWSN